MQESSNVRRVAILTLGCLFLAACPASQSEEELATANGAATNGVALNGVLPVVVALPPNPPDPVSVRPNFDDFSWRSFIALNWPVDPNQRGAPLNPGTPATLTGAGNSYASVWAAIARPSSFIPGRCARCRSTGRTAPRRSAAATMPPVAAS